MSTQASTVSFIFLHYLWKGMVMIKKKSVVSLNYTLKNGDGQELDTATSEKPFLYLHGYGQIVPGLENALEGLTIGDKKEVTVTPEEGYGQVDAGLRMKVNRSNFPKDADIKQGMQFMGEIAEGQKVVFTVHEVDGDEVKVDGNHPLAGQTLNFSVEVVAIREATEEELSHGHVHGEGGHQH
jgi:FKBP-type peptidyl-prolyl cis-trans isomerase SlyD